MAETEERPTERDQPQVQMFNLKTMSGVHPGSRTAIMQRIRLLPLAGNAQPPQWARLLWYSEPPGCVLYPQAEGSEQWQTTPLLHLADPTPHHFLSRLRSALAEIGWQPLACGSCQHWHFSPALVNADNISLGYCRWQIPNTPVEPMPDGLRQQTALALGCPAWEGGKPSQTALDGEAARQGISIQSRGLWAQIKDWFHPSTATLPPSQWGEKIIERSGVGAGTEPCFACQGRIANLGALTVSTDEDDKRTFSIWRCRRCHTFYLNDWTDRWERLDSLETEERYYRLAPAEAWTILALFEGVVGGEHPGGRHTRNEQRQWLEAFIADRSPLSHQVRQGR